MSGSPSGTPFRATESVGRTPGFGPRYRSLRTSAPWLAIALAVVLLPWSNAGSAASIPTNARSPHAFLPPSADAARLSESSAPAGALNEIVPGSVGDLGPPLTRAELAQDRSRIGFNATDPGSGNAVWIAAQQALRSSERPSPGGGSPGPAYRSAAPVSATNASWFVGFVNDSTDRKGLSGVAVAERSATYCDPTICTGATTNSTGAFVMGCEAPGGLGNDYTLQVTGVYWWMDNASYDVCVAGKTTNVGTMFLVRDGSARGTVEEAGTGVPVPNVSVTATSRLGTTVAVPGNTTGASGQFVVAVPAEPSQIYFTPPTGYQTTFNYTNATPGTGSRPTHPPWLNSINAGTIYLTRETVVRATLFDSSTGQPIGASDLSAIQGCNALTGSCPPPGATVYGPNPEAFAEPGPTFFEVDAVGYTVTATPTVTIPPEPPGTPYDLSPVWVTPVGTVSVRPALSMPTGGSLPFTSPSGSPGVIGSYVCSLDGYQFPVLQPSGNFTGFDCVAGPCLSLGASSAIPGAPLRDLVYIFPNTGAACGVWSAPPDTPAFPVQLTVNLTAGYSLAATVPANLSVGDYVAGSILDAATGHAPSGCFIVTARPSDSFYLNTQGIAWNSCLDNSSIYWAPCASLGSLSPGSFCAPVPPGDSYLRVSDLNYASNWTWISVPQYCCHTTKGQPGYPATLRSATSNGVDSINLTPVEGNVTGWVVSGGPSPGGGVPGYSVSVCPMFAPPGTNCGYASARGSRFNVTGAPVGLDLVKVGAVGYSSNSIWLNVSPTGIADAGTIPLDPYGTIAGTVVNPSGNGVYLASIQYCTLDNASACYAGAGNDLGLGFTSTDGTFNGTVPGGWLPGATYVIASTASGYSTNWEFANASADGFVTLPPLTLTPIGVTGGRPMVPTTPKGSTSPPAGVWFTGRLIDSVTSAGVDLGVAGLLAACPLGIGVFCGGVPDGTNSEGFFNGSVSPGLYYVNISTSGYAPASVYLNATGTGFVNLGNIVLRADGWLAGRVVLAPWTSVTLNASGISGQGYAPSAVVTGCDANGSDCQLQLPISSNGTFNVSVPTGSKATIQVAPTAGLLPNTSLESLHGAYTQLSGATSDIPLEIFGEVTGQVLNGNSGAAANLSGRTYIGLPFALVTVVEGGVNPGSSSVLSDTEGMWVAFVPGGNGPGNTTVQATSDPGYDAFFQKVHAAVDPGVGTPSFVSSNLSHYGWIVGQFDAAGSGVPIASASVTVNGVDPGTLANVTVGAETNLDGFVNVTAPPGTLDSLTVSGAFVNATVYAVGTVRGEATTFLSGSSYATLGTQSVESDGWVLSDELTFSSSPPPLSGLPTPVITDPVNGLGVSGAEVTVSSNDPAIAPSVPVRSNSAGQFYTDAPPGGQDLVQVRALGYLPNLTAHSISPGAFDVYSLINLTGDAVIAGTVVAIPNGTGIPGASVALCAPTASGSACSTTTTNQSGAFWATVAPGHTEVWVNASGYVGNSSSVPTCSDCWVSIGAIHLPPDGGVTGKVVGVPANLALSGAQVSVCPQALYQGSPCGLTVETNAHGQFFLTAPPAYYELIAVAPGYNLTASVVQITVGQFDDVGTIYLAQYGNVTGTVVNATDDEPVANASVLACPTYSGGDCAPTDLTDAAGNYFFSSAPGPFEISVSAAGFLVAYARVQVVPASLTKVSTILLYPIGDSASQNLSGRVVEAADLSVGIPGASVAAEVNGTVEYATLTGSNGSFVLSVSFGSYTLIASDGAAGYAPMQRLVDAYTSVPGIVFALSKQVYEVNGTVVDALSHRPLAGVRIEGPVPSNGSEVGLPVLALTDENGSFVTTLPDGTVELVASPPDATTVRYAALEFSVAVNGGRRSVGDLSMAPGQSTLRILVLDGSTLLPVPGATVAIQGDPEPGYPEGLTLTTGSSGSVAATVYYGVFGVDVSATGFALSHAPVNVTGRSTNLTITLTEGGVPSTVAPGTGISTLELAGAGIATVAILGALLLWRRRATGPPTEGAEYAPEVVGPDDQYFESDAPEELPPSEGSSGSDPPAS